MTHVPRPMNDRELAVRVVFALASLVLLLFGWIATRELTRIADTTTAATAKLERLDESLRTLALSSADHARRLDLIERSRLHDCDAERGQR